MTKSQRITIEEIAKTMSSAAARAMKDLREVSDAIAEFREAETMLKGLAASQIIAAENRKPTNGENSRLAYRIDEAAKLLGLSRKTIHRRIADGSLASTKRLGKPGDDNRQQAGRKFMTELDRLREYAAVVGIIDRAAALRIHAIIGALESLILRLDALEVAHGLAAVERREDQHFNA